MTAFRKTSSPTEPATRWSVGLISVRCTSGDEVAPRAGGEDDHHTRRNPGEEPGTGQASPSGRAYRRTPDDLATVGQQVGTVAGYEEPITTFAAIRL